MGTRPKTTIWHHIAAAFTVLTILWCCIMVGYGFKYLFGDKWFIQTKPIEPQYYMIRSTRPGVIHDTLYVYKEIKSLRPPLGYRMK